MSFSISLLFVVIVSFAISLFTSSQMLSIGFKSGKLPGCGKNLMFFWTRNSITLLAVWQGAPSCIKMKSSSLENLRNEPILQKYDVFVLLHCPLDKVQATKTLPWYKRPYHYRIRMFNCSKPCIPVPNIHLYITQTHKLRLVLQKLVWWFVRKAYLIKVLYFCLNEILRNPISNMLCSTHYLGLLAFFKSCKVNVLCCFAHRIHFSFIAVVNRGFLDSLWHLRSCLHNLRRTVLSDPTKSWVFGLFIIWNMLIFLFCLQKFTILCQHAVRSSFLHYIFPMRLTGNSSPFSNFFFIWDLEACDKHIFQAISLREILIFLSNAEIAESLVWDHLFSPWVKKCSKCSSSAEMKKNLKFCKTWCRRNDVR